MSITRIYWVSNQRGTKDASEFDRFKDAAAYIKAEQANVLEEDKEVLGGRFTYKNGQDYYVSTGRYIKGDRGLKYVEDFGEYTEGSTFSRMAKKSKK